MNILDCLLYIKLKSYKCYRYVRSIFFSVSSIKILHNNGIKNVTLRYYAMLYISHCISVLIKIRDYLDINFNKVEFKKHFKDNTNTIIICPKVINNNLTITRLIAYINNDIIGNINKDIIGNAIFMRFEVD